MNDHALTRTRVCLAWEAFRQFKIYTVLGLKRQFFPLPIFCDLRYVQITISAAESDQELSTGVALLNIGALAQVMGFIVVPVSLSIMPQL